MPRNTFRPDDVLPATMTLTQAARFSGLSRSTLRRRHAEGKISLLKADGLVLVDMDSLRIYLASRPALDNVA